MKTGIVLISFLAALLISGAELTIAENGAAKAGILIPENARPVVRVAAAELAEYLKKITGAEFTVGTKSKYKTNFKLGFGDPAGLDNEEFIIRTQDDQIEIFGHDSDRKFSWFQFYYYGNRKGTLQGVYYFLEQLGVRWPAPDMEHVPVRKTLVLKPLDIRFKPYFKDRHIGSGAYTFVNNRPDSREYCKNNEDAMKWYMRIGESPRHVVPGCHSERSLALFKDPEWKSDKTRLQLDKNGKRNPNYSCWTHPDVKRIWLKAADAYFSGKTARQAGFKYVSARSWPYPFVVKDEFMIDPMDNDGVNDGRCYCERCKQFRKAHPCPDDTDLIWEVIADVADFIQKKHPGKYITTLVYPPKRQVPKRQLPSNVRVRVCLSGPKIGLDPVQFENEIKTIRTWHQVTGRKVPLWTYHCVGHGNSMPHIVETYPHLIKNYVQALKGIGEGMYMETHSLTFTRKLLDTYIFHRLMRNPDLDVDRELDEFFRILYGPAHQEAKQFYAELERLFADFWNRTAAPGKKGSLVTPWKYRDLAMQKKLWTMAYTDSKLDELGKLVAAMEKKTANGPYAKPVRMLRKYIYDGMVDQRKLIFGKEDIRKKLDLKAAKIPAGTVPSEEQWKNAAVYHLIPAVPFVDKLDAKGRFQLLSNGKDLFIRAELDESSMDKTQVRKGQKTGSQDIWKDNCVEFYIASMKDARIWQVIINDQGHWSSRRISQGFSDWIQLPGCKVSVNREDRRWTVFVTIPLKTLNPSAGELRLNVARERHVKEKAAEYSTSSPLAMYAVWQDPKNFATLKIE